MPKTNKIARHTGIAGKKSGVFLTRLLVLCSSCLIAYASQAVAESSDCHLQSQRQAQVFTSLNTQYTRCQSVNNKELTNFNYNRDRYLRMMDWVGQLKLENSINGYIDALRQYDYFIGLKLNNVNACAASLPKIKDPFTGQANLPCAKQLDLADASVGRIKDAVQSCRECSLAKIGPGINDSAIELLVVQRKNAHKIRRLLYQKLIDSQDLKLISNNPWLIVRDVFLNYITDSVRGMPHSQYLVTILEALEQSSATMNTVDKSTDDIVSVYKQLALTIQSDDGDTTEQAEKFWNMFIHTVSENKKINIDGKFRGIRSAKDFARYMSLVKPNFRDTAAPVLDTAIKKYNDIRQTS